LTAGGSFDPAAVLAVLLEHRVRFVLIGGIAAAIHGSPYVTTDVDITPQADNENLQRLSNALRALDAKVRSEAEPGGVPFAHDAESLARGSIWNLTTRHGDVHIVLQPAGTSGHDDLARDASELDILGVSVRVASLADVVRSKAAAGRDKDRLQLPLLRRLLEEGA